MKKSLYLDNYKNLINNILISVQQLKSNNKRHLLMTPTGVAAQNVGGKTIHSELKITGNIYNLRSLSVYDEYSNQRLKLIEYIIIEEISMVSSELFTFISKLFQKIHHNSLEFGGIPVLVVGDLAQLPPVEGDLVFYSPLWKSFFPLFLKLSHCQQSDNNFYNILQEVRIGKLSKEIINLIKTKVENYQPLENTLNTTHIISHRATAQNINSIISMRLPSFNSNEESFTSTLIDFVNDKQWNLYQADKAFMYYTNYPSELNLAIGIRVIYLNNN